LKNPQSEAASHSLPLGRLKSSRQDSAYVHVMFRERISSGE
jgi:hypothetical protein